MSVARNPSLRHGLRASALLAVLAFAALATTACEPPRPPAKDKPILFVHGWSALGAGDDCRGNFGALETSLKSAGFTGKMITVGYYDSDTNCDVNLRDWGSVSNSTSWKDLSKALSKYIYATFTAKGTTVDLVGHSMGGLITRGAVQGTQAKESGFSAPIKVEDSVTLAAPHQGAAWFSNGCFWGQCSGLKPGATDIKWLATNANPQSAVATDWTVFGSTADDTVPADSALAMGVSDARKIKYTTLEHSDYMGNATCEARVAKALAEVDS
ncbi:esterase/lipase family protein [Aquihabitans sp. McL0605]|uniref:esterase/lipase family protein n=1 Tax=Aquihabitans sp. McL0605 TaxID=3415671 RepID=UPI003CE7E7E6